MYDTMPWYIAVPLAVLLWTAWIIIKKKERRASR